MRIVVDTNVVISGIFFGGNPRKIVEAIADGGIDAYATIEIMDEYMGIIDSMIERKQGHLNQSILSPLFSSISGLFEEADTSNTVTSAKDGTVVFFVPASAMKEFCLRYPEALMTITEMLYKEKNQYMKLWLNVE